MVKNKRECRKVFGFALSILLALQGVVPVLAKDAEGEGEPTENETTEISGFSSIIEDGNGTLELANPTVDGDIAYRRLITPVEGEVDTYNVEIMLKGKNVKPTTRIEKSTEAGKFDVMLSLDTSFSFLSERTKAGAGLEKFFDAMINSGRDVRVGLIGTKREVFVPLGEIDKVESDFRSAITTLKAGRTPSTKNSYTKISNGTNGTPDYQAAIQMMNDESRKKFIVAMFDGDKVIEEADKAKATETDTTIFTLFFGSGTVANVQNSATDPSRFYDATKSDVTQAWDDIGDDMKDVEIEVEVPVPGISALREATFTSLIEDEFELVKDSIQTEDGQATSEDNKAIQWNIGDFKRADAQDEHVGVAELKYQIKLKSGKEIPVGETEVSHLGDLKYKDIKDIYQKEKYIQTALHLSKIIETMDIPVEKIWEWVENENKEKMSDVEIHLLADGEKLEGITLTLNSSNDWKGVFEKVAKTTDALDPITYTVEEVEIEGFTSEITGDQENGFVVTNKEIEVPEEPKVVIPEEPKVTPAPKVKEEPAPKKEFKQTGLSAVGTGLIGLLTGASLIAVHKKRKDLK